MAWGAGAGAGAGTAAAKEAETLETAAEGAEGSGAVGGGFVTLAVRCAECVTGAATGAGGGATTCRVAAMLAQDVFGGREDTFACKM